MLLSVIIPFHNEEKYILSCADALLLQQAPRESYELIFVDSASDDESSSLLKARHPAIRLLHVDARNPYIARNAGIRAAQGTYIAFTDADCLVSPSWVTEILRSFQNDHADILLGNRLPPVKSQLLHALHDYENAKVQAMVALGPAAIGYGYTCNMAVRASMFQSVGIFDALRKRGGDSELVRRCIEKYPELNVRFVPQMEIQHLEMRHCGIWLFKKYHYGKSHGAIRRVRDCVPVKQLSMTVPGSFLSLLLFATLAAGRAIYEFGRCVGYMGRVMDGRKTAWLGT